MIRLLRNSKVPGVVSWILSFKVQVTWCLLLCDNMRALYAIKVHSPDCEISLSTSGLHWCSLSQLMSLFMGNNFIYKFLCYRRALLPCAADAADDNKGMVEILLAVPVKKRREACLSLYLIAAETIFFVVHHM